MANNVVHTTVKRDYIANYIVDAIDVSGPGYLIFTTGAEVEVARIVFANPAFGPSSAGVATCLGVPLSDTDADGHANPVDEFIIKDGANLEVLRGTVDTTGADINLSSLTIGATDTVTLSALTYTAPQ